MIEHILYALAFTGSSYTALRLGNCSLIDKLWSLLPPLTLGLSAATSDVHPPRLLLILVLSSLWGARLTFNYWRRGGYEWRHEDYRWVYVRRFPAFQKFPLLWPVFVFVFIAGYQLALLWAVSVVPCRFIIDARMAGHGKPLRYGDLLCTIGFLTSLVCQTLADNMQWTFHQSKSRALAENRNHPPFLRQGLFAVSRHPNCFFEITCHWWLTVIAARETGPPFPWTMLGGPVLYALLFPVSTRLTESISASKYPSYKEYQKEVNMLVPWFPRKARG